jgi:rfaE bifunctional protein nucleotidyltransferase chain/domain
MSTDRTVPTSDHKIVSANDAAAILKAWRKSNATVVTTNGWFDILHLGHVRSLQFAASHGNRLIVLVNEDGPGKGEGRPVFPCATRCALLSSLEVVDMVIPFEEDDPRKILSMVRPNFHVKGGDYDQSIIEQETVIKGGGQIIITPEFGETHSSDIIEELKNRGRREVWERTDPYDLHDHAVNRITEE